MLPTLLLCEVEEQCPCQVDVSKMILMCRMDYTVSTATQVTTLASSS